MKTTWTARAHDLVGGQPPTLAGLWTAVRMTELVSAALARATADPTGAGAVGTALFCASAARCLDSARPEPGSAGSWADSSAITGAMPDFDQLPTGAADEPGALRAMDDLLRACLDLAVAVLDNEEEPLSLDQVHEIGAAVGLLDRARATCGEVVR